MSGNAYKEFSAYYDAMMYDVDYVKWSEYLIGFLRRYDVRSVVDVACGTGNITLPLMDAGFSVTGIDLSQDMLNEATRKLRDAGHSLTFVCQDMRSFQVHKPVDAVVCCCDGVNYLTSPEDVHAFMGSCFRALRTGGVLLFDVSSAYKLIQVLGNRTYTEVADGYAYIWQNTFDERTHLTGMDITFFVKEGGNYRRFDEKHVQRAHTVTELRNAAEAVGLTVKGVYEAFTERTPTDACERIQFVCEKEW